MRLFARVLCLEGHEQMAADATAAFHRLVEKVRPGQRSPSPGWAWHEGVLYGQPSSLQLPGAVAGVMAGACVALVLLRRMLLGRAFQ